jgi:hypothetical protein
MFKDMEYLDKVEQEFNKHTNKRAGNKDATGMEMVLQLFLDHPEKIWWWSWEVNGQVNSKGEYLSHRACARASDLALKYPELVEHRGISRFKIYRVRLENIDMVNKFLNI